jgi:hypothetical protein
MCAIAIMTDPDSPDAVIPERSYRLILDPPLDQAGIQRRRRRGLSNLPHGRLVDAVTGQLQISATVPYIEAVIAERGLRVVARETAPSA